jgi:hypothetical protein
VSHLNLAASIRVHGRVNLRSNDNLFDSIAKLAIVSDVDEGVDAAVQADHDDGKVVDRSRMRQRQTYDVEKVIPLVGRPAHKETR